MSRFSLKASCLRLSRESLLKSVAITWKSIGNIIIMQIPNGDNKICTTFAPSFARNKQLALPIPCPWMLMLKETANDINIKCDLITCCSNKYHLVLNSTHDFNFFRIKLVEIFFKTCWKLWSWKYFCHKYLTHLFITGFVLMNKYPFQNVNLVKF